MPISAIAAIISAVAAVTSTAVQAGITAKAANQDSGFSSTSAGEQSMLALQKMKAVDLSRMGGMSPGQYNRYLMGGEVQGIQAQNFANTISQNPFLDAMKKEAYTRMTISSIIAENQKRVAQLTDIDAETAAKNALASAEIAGQASKTESDIIDRQNKIKEIEMLQEQQMWSNFAKLAGSAAKAAGQFVKAGDELGWFDKAKTPTATTSATAPQIDYSPEAVVFRNEKLPDSMTQTTMGITPNVTGEKNIFIYDNIHATQAGLIPNEFNGFKEHYPIDGFDY